MSESKTLFIDYNLCIGCESCEAACKFLHGRPRIHMTRTSGGLMIPIHCHHCDNPGCLRACSVNAFRKDRDGAVVLQPEACIGCMGCLTACPFAAISHTGSFQPVSKCDLCAERRGRGMVPACAEICPSGAILFGTRGEIERELRRRVAESLVECQIRPDQMPTTAGLRQLKKEISVERNE
jgi:Fe-S-cluster-containing dehydrogenase component